MAFVEPNSHVKRAEGEPSIKWRLYAEMAFLGAQDKADNVNCVGVVVFVVSAGAENQPSMSA